MSEPTRADHLRAHLERVVESHGKLSAKRQQHLDKWKQRREAQLLKQQKGQKP